MHVKTRMLSWLSKCDSQVLINQDLLALQKYIAGYACKGAATTEDLIHVYRHLIESTSEESTVKNLAQRLLIKTIGMVDVPGAAADFIDRAILKKFSVSAPPGEEKIFHPGGQ